MLLALERELSPLTFVLTGSEKRHSHKQQPAAENTSSMPENHRWRCKVTLKYEVSRSGTHAEGRLGFIWNWCGIENILTCKNIWVVKFSHLTKSSHISKWLHRPLQRFSTFGVNEFLNSINPEFIYTFPEHMSYWKNLNNWDGIHESNSEWPLCYQHRRKCKMNAP